MQMLTALSSVSFTKMGNKMNEGMLMPYEKLFQKMDKEEHKQK